MLADRDSASVASASHAEVSRATTRVCGDGERSGGGVEGYGARSLTVAHFQKPLFESSPTGGSMAERPLDLCWEALVEETQALPEVERGPLNVALKAIKASCAREGIEPDRIPDEIHRRAHLYRTGRMSECNLTPMALAKNWLRVLQAPSVRLSPEMQTIQRLREQARKEAVL